MAREALYETPGDLVFSNHDLVTCILEFDDSLALFHKFYCNIVGISTPLPNCDPNVSLPCWRHKGTACLALVNKTCFSLVIGEEGRAGWERKKSAALAEKIELAKKLKYDESRSWLERLTAMAVADDVQGLEVAFARTGNKNQGANAAVEEIREIEEEGGFDDMEYNDDDGSTILPYLPNFSFSFSFVREEMCVAENDLILTLAYNASIHGATNAIMFLKGLRFYDNLYDLRMREDFGSKLIHLLIENACYYGPLHNEPVRGIKALLERNYYNSNDLHECQSGCIATALHLAAARGHMSLVRVLVEGGFDPARKCGYLQEHGEWERGWKENRLAEDWARQRRHFMVAHCLRQARKSCRS